MKGRMHRIVKDEGRNPKSNARCVLAIGAVVLCSSLSVAWAQRTREPSDPNAATQTRTRLPQETSDTQTRTRQPQENPDLPTRTREPSQEQLMIQGQRLALEAILEAVRDLAKSARVTLRERDDAQDNVTLILGFELAELQNYIRQLERRLASLDQDSVPRQRNAETATVRRRAREAEEPTKRTPTARDKSSDEEEPPAATIKSQIVRAKARLAQLEEQGQGDSEEAERIRARIQRLREQLAQPKDAEPIRQK